MKNLMRDNSLAEIWVHIPEVVRSIRTPATNLPIARKRK